jgi:hypothetical protein
VLLNFSGTLIRQRYVLRDILGYTKGFQPLLSGDPDVKEILPCAIYTVEDLERPKRPLVAHTQTLRGLSRQQRSEGIRLTKLEHKAVSIYSTETQRCLIMICKMSSYVFEHPNFRTFDIRTPFSKYGFLDCGRSLKRERSLHAVRDYFKNFPKPDQSFRYAIPTGKWSKVTRLHLLTMP